jgi:tetratricopeptide (TPR) repeat protein
LEIKQRQPTHRIAHRHRFVLMGLFFGSVAPLLCAAQVAQKPLHSAGDLQQQYESAQLAQSTSDFPRAIHDYQSFLGGSLRRIAEGYAQAGDYPAAAKFFEEALATAPPESDSSLRLAYAEAALVARDIPNARSLAQAVLADDPKSSGARLVLGEALLQTDENDDARKQLEAAVALEPNYKNGLALATAYLALSDTEDASRIFAEMSSGFGDEATIHLDFGRAYAEAGYPELAIAEFNKAIAKDPTLPEAHYCLGASYLLREGEEGFAKATKEFRRELALHPDDFFSLSQLGYIALTEHRLPEAEAALKRAIILDPRNPDNPLLMGQVYVQLNEPTQAEQSLRQAIALTTDLSRNHYQVQRAHYLLGRLLIQSGRTEEGKQEMQASADLLKQNLVRDQARLAGGPTKEAANATPPEFPTSNASAVDLKTKQQVEAFAARVAPALADSYNNLGAIAAGSSEFGIATHYFEKAAKWNPSLEGLDYNWGRAAFSAEFYAQAVPPLARYLAANPQEQGARRVLGISFFMLKDYAGAVQTLRPIEEELASTPQLDYMYAQSLVLTGDYDRGIARLQRMSAANPSIAEVHRALGEAYASHGEYQQASGELRTALHLNASDSEATDQLALVLTHLEKKSPTDHP